MARGVTGVTLKATSQRETSEQRLKWEREYLGVYLSGHPLDGMDTPLLTVSIAALDDESDGQTVRVAGVVLATRESVTRNRETMGRATLEDHTGSIEVVVFPRTYKQTRELWQLGAVVGVQGRCDFGRARQIVIDKARRLLPRQAAA